MVVKWPMHFNFVLLDRRRLEPKLGLEQLHTMVDSRSAVERQTFQTDGRRRTVCSGSTREEKNVDGRGRESVRRNKKKKARLKQSTGTHLMCGGEGRALPVGGHVAVPRGPLGPVSWHCYRVSSNLGVLGCGQQGPYRKGIQDLTSQLTPPPAWVELRRSTPTCTHCHGRPGDHPHGGNAVVAGGGDGDGCGVEGRGGDAVGLHHRGVMDHMGLSRVHGLGVVSSLETNTHVSDDRPGDQG